LRHFADIRAYLSHNELLDHLIHHHVLLDHLVTHNESVRFVGYHLKDGEEMVYYCAIVHFLDRDGTTLEQLKIWQICT
jgi:hypothetical protein